MINNIQVTQKKAEREREHRTDGAHRKQTVRRQIYTQPNQ